ncbi:MAG: hypothetical protein IJ068_03975, partial [Bacilli bacterium]|nr:hypothetical protein [Bacilli bacterium]
EKELILTIQYIKRETEQVLPTNDVTFTNITASITYGQDETSKSGNGANPSSPEIVQPQPVDPKYTMAQMCPGCIFNGSSPLYYVTQDLSEEQITSEFTSDYTSLNSTNFIGVILEGNIITRAFACGIENGEAFCLEGMDTSKYSNNIDILNHFFPGCNADSSSSEATCYGSSVSEAHAFANGMVFVNNGRICGVDNADGRVDC